VHGLMFVVKGRYMKKLLFFFSIIFFSLTPALHAADLQTKGLDKEYYPFNTTVTAGFVFKHDCRFKQIYGKGMVNAITADFCYRAWQVWGFGAKLSYWRRKGCTSFLQQRALAQQVPFTIYVRGIKTFDRGVQLYASLGAGFIWTREKSYLGCPTTTKGVGEIEAGVNSPVWHHLNLTLALRYLFPPQCYNGDKADVGGVDLRAGIGISF